MPFNPLGDHPVSKSVPDETPFTDALIAFDPADEPFASMDLLQLNRREARSIEAGDMRDSWTARLHYLSRLKPFWRLVGLVESTLWVRLPLYEEVGLLPLWWSARRVEVLKRLVLIEMTRAFDEDAPELSGRSLAEIVAVAEPLAERLAAHIAADPGWVDRIAGELQIPLGDHPATWN